MNPHVKNLLKIVYLKRFYDKNVEGKDLYLEKVKKIFDQLNSHEKWLLGHDQAPNLSMFPFFCRYDVVLAVEFDRWALENKLGIDIDAMDNILIHQEQGKAPYYGFKSFPHNPDQAARVVLMSAYLYYELDDPVLSDQEYDSIVQYVFLNWNYVGQDRKDAIGNPSDMLHSGHQFLFNNRIINAALSWKKHLKRKHDCGIK